MARPDKRYGPGRRRRTWVAWLLDWAAGLLIAIVLLALGAGGIALVVEPSQARVTATLIATMITWPLGAALGVWLSMGRPFSVRALGLGLLATCVGVGLLTSPYWLELELLRTASAIAALIAAPLFARLTIDGVRAREDD
ncbi:hypothetical protein G6O69_34670 [Pseudenhygromyxa sp. WMMC2535]|uniref:hypothetical protein n=1 Tax=Pseudenhygromyxa sp. WMMC2535 TaxID=2712867 RepID=UPI0015518404|nr:hypothetical protein [Pseudenhygromyxa sp. WMMC2535]NVB43018.1 hypothetical protein [Pseudenhygromyxa sp. WMMC2535]